MKNAFKIIGSIVVTLVALALLIALSLGIKAVVNPISADIDRTVFENTQSYVQGKREHLTKLKLDYELASSKAHKESLRQVILMESINVDMTKLPYALSAFIQSLK